MIYELMHKDICVLTMEITDKQSWINRVCEVINPEHLPVGVPFKKNIVDRAELNDWWTKRSIPSSRAGIRNLIETLEIGTPTELLTKGFGLSLSDQYWAKPKKLDLTWKDVNFFDNAFSEDIGDILLGHSRKNKKGLKLSSPDNTSEGNLKKRWKIINNDRVLLKAGSGALQQEVFNEKIASKLMDRLNIPHVNYDILWVNDAPYCACKDFINPDEDLVSAWRFIQQEKQPNHISSFNHLINLAEKNGIQDIHSSLDKMLVVDFLIANEDRHFNNFGFVRDANTLEYKGFAPIFDSGSSLAFEKATGEIEHYVPAWKPFMHGKMKTQLDLVSSFDWINFEELRNFEQDIRDVFSKSNNRIDQARTDAIVEMVNKRIVILENYATAHSESKKKAPETSLPKLTSQIYSFVKGNLNKNDIVNTNFIYQDQKYQILDIDKTAGKAQAEVIIKNCETQECFLEKNFAGSNPFKLNLREKVNTSSLQTKAMTKTILE